MARYASSARKGSFASFSNFFTVCTALSACPLLAGKCGLLDSARDVFEVVLLCELGEFLRAELWTVI